MTEALRPDCPDRSRREFLKTLGTATLSSTFRLDDTTAAAAVTTILKTPRETAVSRFYRSLTDLQRSRICFPAHHPLRTRVQPNWAIVKPTIGDLPPKQRALCADVFHDLCSEDGRKRFLRQMDEDYGGFENYHVAIFGEPDTDQPFEWVLSGRHATLRADGNRIDGLPFTGPIFYGHAGQSGNVWSFQGELARTIFKTFDGTQTAKVLAARFASDDIRSTKQRDVQNCGSNLSLGEFDNQQKAMLWNYLKGLFLPFRSITAASQSSFLGANVVDKFCLTNIHNNESINSYMYTNFKFESPVCSWCFHEIPHVHAWLNINEESQTGKKVRPL